MSCCQPALCAQLPPSAASCCQRAASSRRLTRALGVALRLLLQVLLLPLLAVLLQASRQGGVNKASRSAAILFMLQVLFL